MKKQTKQKCKTEYWMLRCKCERCESLRDMWVKLYVNKIWSDAAIETSKETLEKNLKKGATQ